MHRIRRITIAWLGLACAAQALGATPFLEGRLESPTQTLRLNVSGLPALTNPDWSVTQPTKSVAQRLDPGTLSDPFTTPERGSNYWFGTVQWCEFCEVPYQPRFLVGELLPGEAPDGATLYVGLDRNGDSTPQASEALCQATLQGSTPAQCVADIGGGYSQGSIVYWVAVKTPNGAALTLREAALQGPSGYRISGPGHATAGATLPLRIWSAVPVDTNTDVTNYRYYGVVQVYNPATNASTLVPFAAQSATESGDLGRDLTVTPALTSQPTTIGFAIGARGTVNHTYFDVPATVDNSPRTYSFDIERVEGGTLDQLDVTLVRADFPASSRSADIVAAPEPDATAIHFVDGPLPTTLSLAPGRWYMRVVNNGDVLTAFVATLGATVPIASTPLAAPGFYYNPQRSGHGIAISQASGQQVLDWFTYLEDGTPQWFEAQAAAPPAGIGWWTAPLYRVSWDGAKAHLAPVGTVTTTPVANNEFMLNWQVENATGSEHFSALARSGACPTFNGAATNFTGAWYAPTQSGYGMDVLSLPEQQFAAFYFYDDLGLARWGVGGSVPFASSSTLTLTQNTGFCPSCTYTPVTMQPLGTVDVRYDSASGGNFSSNLVLKAPLSGSWNLSNPMARLTGAAQCQ